MARISKTDHPRILHLVDVDRRKVIEVAAEYGCTAANIYALLGKLRRAHADETSSGTVAIGRAGVTAQGDHLHRSPEGLQTPAKVQTDPDLFPAIAVETREDLPAAEAGTAAHSSAIVADAATSTVAPSASGYDAPRKSPVLVRNISGTTEDLSRSSPRTSLVKAGFGLAMRTADGDENTTPFRSLDDLLSAIKPILRAAARSTDTVWFSIQPIDLATLEIDAA